ncbi:S10 family serine carboxypeptidase-like protein, partial [Salmonella sp. s51228]|uniref:S10 family serine carboxypeptidase-like protein n=1 Tax=Salmonella sp. s51228 TaxID=3159652 RepID=UPI0039814F0E
MIYLDQPAGTGFSYVKNPLGYERNEKTIAREITTFMEEFYAKYTKFADLDFYIIGESYAGHYVPALSAYLLKSSSSIVKNFKGIAIGNGWVDP